MSERQVGDRLYRLARLVLEDDDKALGWLASPQPGLGGRRPADLAHTETGMREIENLLLRIEHGAYS